MPSAAAANLSHGGRRALRRHPGEELLPADDVGAGGGHRARVGAGEGAVQGAARGRFTGQQPEEVARGEGVTGAVGVHHRRRGSGGRNMGDRPAGEEVRALRAGGGDDRIGTAAPGDPPHGPLGVGQGGRRQEHQVGLVRERLVVGRAAVPVVQVGRDGHPRRPQHGQGVGAGLGEGDVRVTARAGEFRHRGGRQPVVLVRAAGVVQREPSAVGGHEVDRALGARGRRDVGERDPPVAVERPDQLTGVVVTDQVDVVCAQAQCVYAHRHEVAGLPGPHLDGGDHVAVGEGQGQLGNVHDRVHPGTAQDEYVDVGGHGSSWAAASGAGGGVPGLVRPGRSAVKHDGRSLWKSLCKFSRGFRTARRTCGPRAAPTRSSRGRQAPAGRRTRCAGRACRRSPRGACGPRPGPSPGRAGGRWSAGGR
ncbi:hypothetical protein SALBM135S_00934 [Streptomyces alboniger]